MAGDQRSAVGNARTSGSSETGLLSATALTGGWSKGVDPAPTPASSTLLVIRGPSSPIYALTGRAATASRITPRPR